MKLALIGLAFFMVVVGINAFADPKVCVLCKHAIAKVIEEYPVIHPNEVDPLINTLHDECDERIIVSLGLKSLCLEAVDALAVPIVKKAGQEGKWDPSHCSVIQLC